MFRAVIVEGTRFESPFRLNRGVVLSFPTMLRAVWMDAIVVVSVVCMSDMLESFDSRSQS